MLLEASGAAAAVGSEACSNVAGKVVALEEAGANVGGTKVAPMPPDEARANMLPKTDASPVGRVAVGTSAVTLNGSC